MNAVDGILYVLDQAYDGDEEHGLLANLRSVRDEDWNRPATDAARLLRSSITSPARS